FFEAPPSFGGYGDRVGYHGRERGRDRGHGGGTWGCPVGAGQEVDLVEGRDAGLVGEAEVAQCALHCLGLARRVRVGDIDDVQQHGGIGQLLERRAEGGDELRWQLLDEADGVGEQCRVRLVEVDAPCQRVQRREELVLDEDLAVAGQRPHQRAL